VTFIRAESPEDVIQVRVVNEAAFGQPTEADIVDRLRLACKDSLSLVAEDDGVVGHILFTPVVIESPGRRVVGMGLAPMAVLPGCQRRGIGCELVRRGLQILRDGGVLSALRVRARIGAQSQLPMGRRAGRGIHGPHSGWGGDGGCDGGGEVPR
jgi:predicted N-acetyltransferase YhbS